MSRKGLKETHVERFLPEVLPRLWRFCLFLTSNPDTASDLAQSTCLRALEKKDLFSIGSKFDSWIFKMAHRLWLNQLRESRRQVERSLYEVSEPLTHERDSPENIVYIHEVFTKVDKLPDKQRICVLLVYVEGFTYSQAAEVLEVPVGTVMSRLAAARKTLSADLRKSGGGGDG